jgi:hypothetical protein
MALDGPRWLQEVLGTMRRLPHNILVSGLLLQPSHVIPYNNRVVVMNQTVMNMLSVMNIHCPSKGTMITLI